VPCLDTQHHTQCAADICDPRKLSTKTQQTGLLTASLQLVKMCYIVLRDVKRTSNLRTSKFIFEFEILTFDIRVKFALEHVGIEVSANET